MLIQAFLSQPPIKGLDRGMVGRRAKSTECQLDAAAVRPFVERLRDELRAIVDLQDLRKRMGLRQALQNRHYSPARQRRIDLNGGTLTTHVIHYRYGTKTPPIIQAS